MPAHVTSLQLLSRSWASRFCSHRIVWQQKGTWGFCVWKYEAEICMCWDPYALIFMALPCLWCKVVQSLCKARYRSSIPASSTPLWNILSTFFVLHHLIRRSQGYAHYFRGPHSAMLVCPMWMELHWWRDRHPASCTLPVGSNRSATEWPLIFNSHHHPLPPQHQQWTFCYQITLGKVNSTAVFHKN